MRDPAVEPWAIAGVLLASAIAVWLGFAGVG